MSTQFLQTCKTTGILSYMKIFVATILLLCSIVQGQQTPLRLEFGVYPSDRAAIMYRKFSPVLDAIRVPIENILQREVDIHMTIFQDYDSGIKALANGDVDFVRFGPSSFIIAEQLNPEVQILAMELRKGLKRFNGVIIARKDSGIKTVQDLHGRSFAFGDPNSTIGTFLAQAMLVEHGIQEAELASHEYLGRHDKVAKAIITGTHDAGALKSSTYKTLCNPKDIIIVKAFSNVTKPWVARSELSKEICAAITASLLALESEEALRELGCSGFAEASPDEYDLVRVGMEKAISFYPIPEEEPEN
jgi:phosphonate transport system substrate-binding protein